MKFSRRSLETHRAPKIPLDASLALAERSNFSEPFLLDEWVFWLEQRPHEGGRTTIVFRKWGKLNVKPQELTPAPINVRTRVHTYGGGAKAAVIDDSEIVITWIDDCDGCLWCQAFSRKKSKERLNPTTLPRCLSIQGDYLLADGLLDLKRRRWIGVMEENGQDFLVAFPLDKVNQEPQIIYRPQDFIGYAVLSPDRDQLAWVEWQQPRMPWDESQLWWGHLDDVGNLSGISQIAGSMHTETNEISVFQPVWLKTGELVVAEDSSGWWNLIIAGPEFEPNMKPVWNSLGPIKAEAAMPQWIYGMSTIAVDDEKILNACCDQGRWGMRLYKKDGSSQEVNHPFDDLAYISVVGERLLAIAGNSFIESGLLELDLTSGNWIHTPVRARVLEEDQISAAEDFWFEGFEGKPTHAWYYPPQSFNQQAAPLLVRTHSGPTAMASKGLNLGIQFWTSRGWGVVDVNYGGSTGFGRSYRERLKNGWGMVEVDDCAKAAQALIDIGKANRNMIAIEGGSAGGFTTLACLCFKDIFRVAACRYAVSDLIAMAQTTHRFEANYLEYLLGPLHENRDVYTNRSPINHVDSINCPVIFFQGLKDNVVLPSQTKIIADALRKKKIPVQVHTYSEEGHGFRSSIVKVNVLVETEKFFRHHLSI